MSDRDEQHEAEAERPVVLGHIPRGEVDHTIDSPSPLRISRRREGQVPETPRLPRGAWLRLRIAGGFVFRTSELVVYEDSRLSYRSSATSVYGQTLMVRQLTETQIGELRQAIAALDLVAFANLSDGRGRDTITYELALRDGRKTHTVTASQGVMPDELGQVINQLGDLVRIGADEMNV